MSASPTITGANERITREVSSWPGVTTGLNARGGQAFFVGRREIGHLHGDRALHTAFPRDVWQWLRDQGRIDHHPVFPDRPGPASRTLRSEEDIEDAIALLRINYDRRVLGSADGSARQDGVVDGGDGRARPRDR